MANTTLVSTLVRELMEDKDILLKELTECSALYMKITLSEEPGEVLILDLLTENEIIDSVKEAVQEVFAGKNVVVFNISRKYKTISFMIEKTR